MGRFISEDPSGFDGGDANLFRYVGNDPINHTDPTGLFQAGNPVQSLYSTPSASDYSAWARSNTDWTAPAFNGSIYASSRAALETVAPFSASGITQQYIDSGAARLAVEQGGIQFAQDTVKYGTPSQAFTAKLAIGLNGIAESSNPLVGQLNAWGMRRSQITTLTTLGRLTNGIAIRCRNGLPNGSCVMRFEC